MEGRYENGEKSWFTTSVCFCCVKHTLHTIILAHCRNTFHWIFLISTPWKQKPSEKKLHQFLQPLKAFHEPSLWDFWDINLWEIVKSAKHLLDCWGRSTQPDSFNNAAVTTSQGGSLLPGQAKNTPNSPNSSRCVAWTQRTAGSRLQPYCFTTSNNQIL